MSDGFMMKLVGFILLLLCCSPGLVRAIERYEFADEELLDFASYEALLVSEQLASFGLRSYPGTNFRRLGLPFDQLYHSAGLQKMVALKFGLRPVGPKEVGVISVEREGLVVWHGKVQGVWALVVAVGMGADELGALVAPWREKRAVNFDWVLPRAHASEYCQSVQLLTGPLEEFATSLSVKQMSAQIGSCLATAAHGLTENLKNTLDFYRRLATEPLAVWREFKQGMAAFGQVIVNLRSEVAGLLERMQHFSPAVKAEVVCGMAGQMLGAAGQALLLGPRTSIRELAHHKRAQLEIERLQPALKRRYNLFLETIQGPEGVQAFYRNPGSWHMERLPQFGKNAHSVRLNGDVRVLFDLDEGKVLIREVNRGHIHGG